MPQEVRQACRSAYLAIIAHNALLQRVAIDLVAGLNGLGIVPMILDLGGQLSIWNYSGADDFLSIATGTAFGSLAQVAFYSDSGSTFLGYGGFESTRLVPVAVPEPATLGMAAVGLAALAVRRIKTARCRARSR